MPTDRLKRVNELLKREIATQLFRLLDGANVDVSAITVTHVETSPDLRHARIYVSILGHENERDDILRKLNRERQHLVQHLRKTIKLKYLPSLSFRFDPSIANGDRVLQILSEIDEEMPPEDEE